MDLPSIKLDKVIRDPVHGYIKLTNLEFDLIQLPVFLRLHRIKQGSTAYLTYPGSLNSRFGHVVGAMHLGHKIITQLLATLDPIDFKKLFPTMNNDDLALLIKSVRLACLFHDLGHGPFSHAGEKLMLTATKEYPEEIEEAKRLFDITDVEKLPIHEYYSYKLIKDGEVAELLKKEDSRLVELSSSLIIKKSESQIVKDNVDGFSILHKIVSSQLDADRMDYLMRDGLMSGVTYGQIDADRVIMNMAIIHDKLGGYELAIHSRALGAIEDMLDARFKMYKWLYQHHTVVATDNLMQLALQKLVKLKKTELSLFHWKKFSNGLSNDDFILNKLIECWCQNSSEFESYKGLWDRRFIPTSILKRPSDYPEFAFLVQKYTGRHQSDDVIGQKIKEFSKSTEAEKKLDAEFQTMGEPLKNTNVIIITTGRAPYQPLSEEDNVWLFDEQGEIHELMKKSAYTSHINQEWQTSPSVYISCFIPNVMKSKIDKLMKEKMRDAIIKAIFPKKGEK